MIRISQHSDDPRSHLRRPEFPDANESGGPVDAVGAEVDDEELIVIAVEDVHGDGVEAGDLGFGEDAEKDGELDVVKESRALTGSSMRRLSPGVSLSLVTTSRPPVLPTRAPCSWT